MGGISMVQVAMWVAVKKGEERQHIETSGMMPIISGGIRKFIPEERVIARPHNVVYGSLVGLACDVLHSGQGLDAYYVALVVADNDRFTPHYRVRIPTPRDYHEQVDLVVSHVTQGEAIESKTGFVSLDDALLAYCPKETFG